jgi:hypothetical protein
VLHSCDAELLQCTATEPHTALQLQCQCQQTQHTASSQCCTNKHTTQSYCAQLTVLSLMTKHMPLMTMSTYMAYTFGHSGMTATMPAISTHITAATSLSPSCSKACIQTVLYAACQLAVAGSLTKAAYDSAAMNTVLGDCSCHCSYSSCYTLCTRSYAAVRCVG